MFAPRIASIQISLCLAAVAAATTTAAGAQESGYLGYVWDYSGAWFIGDDTIRIGRALGHSDSVRVDTASAPLPALVILLENGDEVRLLCHDAAACAGPIVPADSVQERRFFDAAGRIVRAVAAVLRDEPESETIRARTRGTDAGARIVPAIVSRARDSVELTPIFADAEAGDYRISLHRDRPIGRVLYSTVVTWRPAGRVSIEADGVGPGLHTVVVEPSAEPPRWRTSALVLVVHESRYDELHARYDQAVALTDNWAERRAADARHFLASYIRFLAAVADEK